MKKTLAYPIFFALVALAVAFAAIHFTNNAEKNKQIESLSSNVSNLNGQVENLTNETNDKASQIEALTLKIADKDEEINTLTLDVNNKAKEIEALNTTVSEKDKKIDSLTADVNSKTEQINTLNTTIAEKDAQINTLTEDNAGKAKQIETLTGNVTEQNTKIASLTADLKNAQDKEKALNDEIDKAIDRIFSLVSESEKKDAQIDALTKEVNEKSSKIEELNTAIAERDSQITSLKSEIKTKDDQIALLKEMVSSSSSSSSVDVGNNQLVIAPTEAFVIERLSSVEDISSIAAATEDHDPNGNLGKQGGYTAQVFFSTPLVNPSYANLSDYDLIEIGTIAGGSIEVYETVADAEKRNNYLASFDGSAFASGSHTVLGTMVVRTSNELTASNQKKLAAEIVEALSTEGDVEKQPESSTNMEESNTPTESVSVKEAGFQVVGKGYLYYSFIAHNNLSDTAAYLPEFSIVSRNANGELLSADSQILKVIYPGQDTVYAGLSKSVEEIPTSVEISYVEPDDDWHLVKPSKLEHAEYLPLEVKSAKLKDGKSRISIVGEVFNPNDYNLSSIAITIVFRDTEGKLIGGDTTFVHGAKGKKNVAFEMNISKELVTDDYEIYAQPW